MQDLTTLLLFAAACLAMTSTPGPDMLLMISRTTSQGRASGFATFLGIAVGTYIHAIAAAFGLSELFLAIPMAYDIVRYAGAAYLLYLAYKTLSSNTKSSPSPQKHKNYTNVQVFVQGLITNLLNPKIILFVLALFPQFVQPESGNVVMQILILATIFNFIGFIINGSVILMSAQITKEVSRRLAIKSRMAKLPQYILASVFGGLAIRLLLSEK